MKKEVLITFVIIVISFVAGVFLSDYVRSSKSPENSPSQLKLDTEDLLGQPSPDFSLMDVSGQLRNVSEWKDKVLVLNFWATWCPPCLEEIPHFINLQDKYGDQGLQFLGIALEGVADVQAFAHRLGINYPLLVGEQEVINLAGKLGNHAGGLPYTVVIDRNGRIDFIKKGPISLSETEQVIIQLL